MPHYTFFTQNVNDQMSKQNHCLSFKAKSIVFNIYEAFEKEQTCKTNGHVNDDHVEAMVFNFRDNSSDSSDDCFCNVINKNIIY